MAVHQSIFPEVGESRPKLQPHLKASTWRCSAIQVSREPEEVEVRMGKAFCNYGLPMQYRCW
ncbi:MAG: hypothetical protein ACI9G1_003465 [Pirellulaceae bacterium]|jgi:hypothetical protein